ncbi:Hypothetical protein LBF_2209 [Leptospira biflexa serovar Patoc strain 'Patoc 1 (Ames)']|uniref:Uncharacterized protein n=1 Tax=Leptospira biflexa serovar Patoc (strain Patoc 1 / ATCC 23582 / Paris) TaxID=456481 RepID=B0STD1_LEPBP|nr:hypothetical protein [Leptospira biflexa]ABZ94705.1 Hypothetical protein LBF_2209 [Leptospira biflexa serovar Patoc strain 'Patoc 1 (Ames)']ABZ98371.1 Hypothetical protein LEPBI_I2276 [Leptospira biflexa serovar Patoc strain 'Patoc 1 (Paris)']
MELLFIKEKLTGQSFVRTVSENIDDWMVGFAQNENNKENIHLWFDSVINQFLHILDDVEDKEELSVLLFSKYVELKCYWKQLNTQIQYQNFNRGDANPELIIKASLITYILIALEPLIHEEDLNEIQEFLTKPIRELILEESSPENNQNHPEDSQVYLLEQQLHALYYDKEKLFRHLRCNDTKEVVVLIQNMREQVKSLQLEMEDSCVLDGHIRFTGKRKIRIQKT